MPSTTRHALVPIATVFEVISDPRTYPEWLVGAKQIRSVDEDWPKPGSRFHHRVGLVGPLQIPDHSELLEIEPPTPLALEVLARPLIRARVDFRLLDEAGRTRITMDEEPIGWAKPLAPLFNPSVRARNRASLNALVAHLNEPA